VEKLTAALPRVLTHFPHWGGRIRRWSALAPSATGVIGERLLVIDHQTTSINVYHGRYEGKKPLILDLTKVKEGSVDELRHLAGPE
jgi:hypothetical protein